MNRDRSARLRFSASVRKFAAGLAAAHTLGLVHRDIKPANIMLADGLEQVAITDFGLARAVDDATMTRSGVIAGTPQYMSPEQARRRSDRRSKRFVFPWQLDLCHVYGAFAVPRRDKFRGLAKDHR